MRCDFSMGNTSMKLIAGALLVGLASAASAGTIVGGGATLPAIGYTAAATGTPITPGAGSLFAVYTANGGNAVTYCPTGSGAGKKILAGNDSAFQVTAACGGTPVAGFGASATSAYFAGSDAPMSQTEYSNYVNSSAHSPNLPTQLPSIAGSIAVVFNKAGVNAMTLTEGQICGVFSGQIKTWQDLKNSGVTTIPTTATGNINVVYRSDGSGTSFSFLNHLSDVCQTSFVTGQIKNTAAATEFTTTQTFVGTFEAGSGRELGAQAYLADYAASAGASGNAGVTAAVNATDGSIGYAEAANGVVGTVKMATVKNTAGQNVNPLTNFGQNPVTVTVTFNKAIDDLTNAQGRPTLSFLPGFNSASPAGCVGLVDPNSYSNPAAATSTAYPIIAVTNLLGNSHGNGTDAAAVRTLLGSPYNTNTAFRSAVTKIGRLGSGYAWLSSADLTQAKVDSCIVN